MNTATDGSSASPPVVPPRQRHNPFNVQERENNCNTINCKVVKKQNFATLHTEYGQQIIKNRELWNKAKKSNANSLTEDVLITL